MKKLVFYLYIFIATFFAGYFSYASDILIEQGISGHYESEKYLASQYLVTNLHLSPKIGKRPLLLILGGSNEGFTHRPGDWQIAEFLNRGYHVLEAEFFLKPKVGTIPDKLSQIRLESFWEQISEYLNSDKIPKVIDHALIGIMGTSKGGELALLLGSLYQQFKFVIAIVPSHVVFQGSNTTLYHYSSWTFKGQELPFVPFSNFSIATIYGVLTRIFCSHDKVNFTWMHTQALRDKKAVERALIKVENINGPILLISGTKDQWWPSADMSQQVMKRLEESKFAHSYIHIECETDHYPFWRKPHVWPVMLDQIDRMLLPKGSLSSSIEELISSNTENTR